jgi:hypothetical protein
VLSLLIDHANRIDATMGPRPLDTDPINIASPFDAPRLSSSLALFIARNVAVNIHITKHICMHLNMVQSTTAIFESKADKNGVRKTQGAKPNIECFIKSVTEYLFASHG